MGILYIEIMQDAVKLLFVTPTGINACIRKEKS